MVGKIIPQLRLGEDDELPMTISLLSAPEINETRERHLSVEEMDAPHTCQLHAVVSRIEVVVLKKTLVKQLKRPSGGVVGCITIVGDTCEGSLLITA